MRMPNMEVVVRGMKRSKGDFEGVAYDSTKFYIETDLDDSKGNGWGSATSEYSMGSSQEADKFSHLTFPFAAVADMEVVTSGKAVKVSLVSLKPKAAAPKVG